MEGLLTEAEANAIIDLARNSGVDSWRVAASVALREGETGRAADAAGSCVGSTGGQVVRSIRGRHNSWCAVGEDHELLRRAVRRVTLLCGLSPAHAEHCQVVHYAPGQSYQEHCDYFPLGHNVGPSGNRLVSVFVYLSGCRKGGETQFHLLDLAVSPVCGNALVWLNIYKRNQLDGRTLHSGCPVLEGEKWGMNIWLRQRPHGGDRPTSCALSGGEVASTGKVGGASFSAPRQTAVSRAYPNRLQTAPTKERSV